MEYIAPLVIYYMTIVGDRRSAMLCLSIWHTPLVGKPIRRPYECRYTGDNLGILSKYEPYSVMRELGLVPAGRQP